jgi:hypothetical protein
MDSYVIKAHKSNYPNPVEFKSKDMLDVGAEDMEYPGWIWVITRDGNEGWAPIEYVIPVDGSKQGVAISNYCARELDVEIGEKLQIYNTVCGWHYATNSRGENGWVPQECLRFASQAHADGPD